MMLVSGSVFCWISSPFPPIGVDPLRPADPTFATQRMVGGFGESCEALLGRVIAYYWKGVS